MARIPKNVADQLGLRTNASRQDISLAIAAMVDDRPVKVPALNEVLDVPADGLEVFWGVVFSREGYAYAVPALDVHPDGDYHELRKKLGPGILAALSIIEEPLEIARKRAA